MKKKAFMRGLLGFPLGIAVGYIITLIISVGWGNGQFIPCVPDLEVTMGSQLNAVVLQTILSGVLGGAFAACSVIWEIDSWSIVKQSGIFFLITSVVMMPIAYFTNWMEHSILGAIKYYGIFLIIFVITWISQYFAWKSKVKKINDQLK